MKKYIKSSHNYYTSGFGFDFVPVWNYSEDIEKIVKDVVEHTFNSFGYNILGYELRDVTDLYGVSPEYKEYDVFQVGVDFGYDEYYDPSEIIEKLRREMRDAGYMVIGNPEFYGFDD